MLELYMNTDKSFAELLRYWRSKAGISQEELAKKSGVSKIQIAKYETNKSTPRLKAIMKLADALNISIEDLGYKSPSKILTTERSSDGTYIRKYTPEAFKKLEKFAEEIGMTVAEFQVAHFASLVKEYLGGEKALKHLNIKAEKTGENEITFSIKKLNN